MVASIKMVLLTLLAIALYLAFIPIAILCLLASILSPDILLWALAAFGKIAALRNM